MPSWPELQAKPDRGGVDPAGPPAQRGSTGKAGQGGALPCPLPPQSKHVNPSPEDAESKGAGKALDVDELVIQALTQRFEAAGYMRPDWPPFTARAVCEAAADFGSDAVDLAAKRFLDAGGDNLTPKRFGNQLGDWLRTVPQQRRRCHRGHSFEGALIPRSDFPNGPQLRARRCTWCGFTEPAGATMEAATEHPACSHARTETLSGEFAEKTGTAGQVLCTDCGAIVAGVQA